MSTQHSFEDWDGEASRFNDFQISSNKHFLENVDMIVFLN